MSRIKPTDVTNAYRAAVSAATLAGVDVSKWTLKIENSAFQIVTIDPDDGHHHIVAGLGTSYAVAFDALHSMRRAWELVPRIGAPGRWPCWHVESSDGHLYGVAASTGTLAKDMLNARLAADESSAHATKATLVDVWDADYGTVFCYA